MVNNLISLLMGKLRSLVGRYVVSRKAHDALGLERNALKIERDALLAEVAPARLRKERISRIYETTLEEFSGFKTCKSCVDKRKKAFEEYSENEKKREEEYKNRKQERYNALSVREKKLIKYGVYPRWYLKPFRRDSFDLWCKAHGIFTGMFEGCEECIRLCQDGLEKKRPYERIDNCKCNVIGCTNNSETCENIDPDDYNEED